MTRLKSMFTIIGTVAIAGTVFTLALLKPQFDAADAVDAGILVVSTPARLLCRARVVDACAADAGLARPYVNLQLRAQLVRDAGVENLVAIDLPNRWRECLRVVGTEAEACTVLEEGTCSVPAVCAANAPPQVQQDQCACRQPDAGACTVGGQPATLGVTLAAGSWVGPGCRRKYCGPEVAGEQGGSWPVECPQ